MSAARRGVGKGWTYTQEREHAQNFKPLGADWTYENDGGFLLGIPQGPSVSRLVHGRVLGVSSPG